MNRYDLQSLARIRLQEAECLMAAGFQDGAYYLCGYAVECALKACIAKQTQAGDFPERNRVNDSYSHDLMKLTVIAGLKPLFEEACRNDKVLERYWTVAKDWNESSRYESRGARAQDLIEAITDPIHGVMRWLQQHW
ncbi:MAG: HEPN domain-containing protein [Verrucomicrobia bacterium]|nr:HEPN domain-containing protein [Verrucomicrobiota bacterium]